MITIEVTENGYISIDVPDRDAVTLNAEVYTEAAEVLALRVAHAIAPGSTQLLPLHTTKKRGLSNRGWTAVYRDQDRKDRYLASRFAGPFAANAKEG